MAADPMSLELISGVAAASAGLSGTGVWGVLKLLDLRRSRNGDRPVSDALCLERVGHVTEKIDGAKEHLDKQDAKLDKIIEILGKNTA